MKGGEQKEDDQNDEGKKDGRTCWGGVHAHASSGIEGDSDWMFSFTISNCGEEGLLKGYSGCSCTDPSTRGVNRLFMFNACKRQTPTDV